MPYPNPITMRLELALNHTTTITTFLTRHVAKEKISFINKLQSQVASGGEGPKETAKADGIQDKSGIDDDDLLKSESQDVAEHKQLYQHLHQVCICTHP